MFYRQKLYWFTWAYVSVQELVLLLRATAYSFLLSLIVLFLLRDDPLFSAKKSVFCSIFGEIGLLRGSRFLEIDLFQGL
jgi:FlaA1/EpsC-like NDP-sugar epimerase